MKALSIKQPWAYLISEGVKTVELRNWSTKYRGPLLIHASKEIDKESYRILTEQAGFHLPAMDKLVTGAVVGQVELVDVEDYDTASHFLQDTPMHLCLPKFFEQSRHGFVLRNAIIFNNPFPCSGKLSLFDIELPKETI